MDNRDLFVEAVGFRVQVQRFDLGVEWGSGNVCEYDRKPFLVKQTRWGSMMVQVQASFGFGCRRAATKELVGVY